MSTSANTFVAFRIKRELVRKKKEMTMDLLRFLWVATVKTNQAYHRLRAEKEPELDPGWLIDESRRVSKLGLVPLLQLEQLTTQYQEQPSKEAKLKILDQIRSCLHQAYQAYKQLD